MSLNELHLFAGGGGGILGGILCGHTCVCAVEIDEYCRNELLQRQRDGILPRFPIWDDVRTFDGRPWRGRVDIVAGGFPCQDISCAGKGKGIAGERSGLWAHMFRVVCEVRPRFVLVENSPMLTSRGLGRVLGDLASVGFDAEWCVLGADDAGAPHVRKRIWILGHSRSKRCDTRWNDYGSNDRKELGAADKHSAEMADAKRIGLQAESNPLLNGEEMDDWQTNKPRGCCEIPNPNGKRKLQSKGYFQNERGRAGNILQTLPHPMRTGCKEQHAPNLAAGPGQYPWSDSEGWGGAWWATEPKLGRVVNELAGRMDKSKPNENGGV